MGPFHHIQHQGQHNLHTDHASFYLHLPKKKEKKYFTYKRGPSLMHGKQLLIMSLFLENDFQQWDL
jgi:hypothetical protein